jgi:GntR family transcriptional regulator
MDEKNPLASLNRSAVARYIQLAMLFRRRIETGEWRMGAQIPTVDDLALEFGVARATIRQALGLLEDERLIDRFRAKGTFVTQRTEDRIWCEVETDWGGLMRAREGADIEILFEELTDRAPMPPHEIGKMAPSYLHLRRRHSRAGSAFLVAEVFIEEQLSKKIPRASFTTKTAMSLVASLRGVKIADSRQTLTIGAADVETANYLNVPLNAPVAHVHRSIADNRGRIILLSNGTYRGDLVRLDVKLK